MSKKLRLSGFGVSYNKEKFPETIAQKISETNSSIFGK